MKIRFKDKRHIVGDSSEFNVHALAEVIVTFPDGERDSVFIRDLEVMLPTGWHDMNESFGDGSLIRDNYNTCFFPPANEAERKQGYRL